MKFLLKIVQGPNAGAEIALVEGVRVTLGSADSCDIVLADPTLPAEACAIEVSADAVVLTPTGAAPESLEPLRVRSFGSTALAVGPADAPWGPLVWEAPASAPAPAEEKAAAEEPPSPGPSPAEPPAPTPPSPSTSGGSGDKSPGRLVRRLGCLVVLVLLLLVVVLALLNPVFRHRARSRLVRMGLISSSPASTEKVGSVPEAPAPKDPAGVTLFKTNGVLCARGDFATRAERLAATAALYEAHPGIKLDLADRETLLSTTADLLQAATDGVLEVTDITNRVAVLAGRAPDPAFLRAALEALRTDVPRLSGVDTAAVTLDSPVVSAAPTRRPALVTRPASPVASAPAAPRLPLCGVLLQPYPCLVLQNGQRLAVGSEVGGYKIETIASDRITLRRGEEEPVEWTP